MSSKPNLTLLRWRLLLLALTLISVSLSLLAFSRVYIQRVASRAVDVQPTITSLSDQKKSSLLLETEVISVTPRGFEPQAISRPRGQFILMIENPQAEALDLQLSHETGSTLKLVRTSRAEPEWNDIQDLAPGHYVLTEENHPEWKCFITITQR